MTRRAFIGSLAAGCGTLVSMAQEQRKLPPEALAAFSAEAQRTLLAAILAADYRGRLEGSVVRALMPQNKSLDALMLDLLPLARIGARPPLSNFLVGAVVAGSSGALYLGANIEVPRQALGATVHAEQAAVANAYMSRESGIASIAVTAAPCGHCRQFLNEMALDGNIRVLVAGAPPTRLAELLPNAFGPKDLGLSQGALPVKETNLSLRVRSRDPLALAALDAARWSYAPYTNSYSGIAILTTDKRTFTGSYIENAAFNPSLSPLQSALAGLAAAGGNPANIGKAVLVEMFEAKMRQNDATRAALSSVAPNARLQVLTAIRG